MLAKKIRLVCTFLFCLIYDKETDVGSSVIVCVAAPAVFLNPTRE